MHTKLFLSKHIPPQLGYAVLTGCCAAVSDGPQSLVLASVAPALPVAAATEAEEVGHMCQQLRQCVGACQLSGTATTSGGDESDESDSDITPMQVGLRGAPAVIQSLPWITAVDPHLICIEWQQMQMLSGNPIP